MIEVPRLGKIRKLLIPRARVPNSRRSRLPLERVVIACKFCYWLLPVSIGALLIEKNRRMPGRHSHQPKADRPRWLQRHISASNRVEFPIVAIGASAGGLDACRKLLDALPATTRMAFIIVQHLDPSHDSMMVDLLAGHTLMPVLLATDGMRIKRERVYFIPPGVYLSADQKGALRFRSRRRDTARGSPSTSC